MRTLLLLGLAGMLLAADAEPLLDEGTPFTTTRIFRNPYDRAVHIDRLDSTCTCTTLTAEPRFLLPGATATLTVVIDTHQRSGHQDITASVYFTDPEFEPVDIPLAWTVRGAVTVDAVPPRSDPHDRPADAAWRDVTRYVSQERPDDLSLLRKRIRLGSDTPPAGGLRIERIEYPGTLWAFTSEDLGNGAWLITAKARDPNETPTEGTRQETVTVHTNHPSKPMVTLQFVTVLSRAMNGQTLDPLAPRP